MKDRIIAALMRIYSSSWRREYGPELEGILEKRKLELRTVLNVAWHAASQRIRATEPWMLMGSAFALWSLGFFAWMIVAPPVYAPQHDVALQLENVFSPARLVIGTLILLGCGFWTVARSGGTLPHAGVQTMKMVLLANAVHVTVLVLMLSGVLGVTVITPGDTPTTILDHGFAVAWHSAEGQGPNEWFLLLIRIPGVLESWVWGAFGGALGRLFRHETEMAA